MHTIARTAVRAFTFASLLFAPSVAWAQTTYTSFTDFTAALSVQGTDRFDDLVGFYDVGPITRTVDATAYTAQAAGAPFDVLLGVTNPSDATDAWLSTEEASAPLVFSGFGAEVFGFGGRFFATNLSGSVTGTKLLITAMDVLGNTVSTTISPAAADAFFGVTFTNALASFTITADNSSFAGTAFFATANDVVLGGAKAVPEPATVWLVLTGITGLLLIARRRVGGSRR